ncbi:hypothetical protein EJB05_03322 [Eragrostis curvula]|uniref:Uncharacterized protein n=1 Tax=Eragrostis curvula TaxID=38414 RepID=A0A5J9W585_9POAL|nr:hypothetical protein EJB05_03322 [Eragrostis curvula]
MAAVVPKVGPRRLVSELAIYKLCLIRRASSSCSPSKSLEKVFFAEAKTVTAEHTKKMDSYQNLGCKIGNAGGDKWKFISDEKYPLFAQVLKIKPEYSNRMSLYHNKMKALFAEAKTVTVEHNKKMDSYQKLRCKIGNAGGDKWKFISDGKASLFAPAQFKATHSNRMSLYYKNMVWINKPGLGLLGHVKSRLVTTSCTPIKPPIPYCLVIRRSFSDSSKNPSKQPEDTLYQLWIDVIASVRAAFIDKIGGGFVSVVWLGFGYILSVLCGMISDSEAKVEGKKSENSEIAEAVQQGLRNAREIQIYELWSALTALKMDVDAFKVLILPLIIKGSPKVYDPDMMSRIKAEDLYIHRFI